MSSSINQSPNNPAGDAFNPVNLPPDLPPEALKGLSKEPAVGQTGGQVFKDTVANSSDFYTGGSSHLEIPPPSDSKTPPLPSPALHAEASATGTVSLDSDAAAWFTGNALATLRIISLDLQKTNRAAAMQMELAVAKFMNISQELSEAKAKLTRQEYNNQAEQAMMDMIGAAVQLGVTTVSAGVSVVGGTIGAAKGFAGSTATTRAGVLLDSAKGFGGGVAATAGISQAMSGAAQGASGVITNAFKIGLLREMGRIKGDQQIVDMAQQAMNKVMETVTKMADNNWSMNDANRQALESISKDVVRYFGQLGA